MDMCTHLIQLMLEIQTILVEVLVERVNTHLSFASNTVITIYNVHSNVKVMLALYCQIAEKTKPVFKNWCGFEVTM